MLKGGGEGPFVELWVPGSSIPITLDLRPREARQLARRLYIAARAAEHIAAIEKPT